MLLNDISCIDVLNLLKEKTIFDTFNIKIGQWNYLIQAASEGTKAVTKYTSSK